MFKVTALPALHGDCLWIEYGDSNKPSIIVIDGGPPEAFSPLLERLRSLEEQGRSVRLLIVTHIDLDHIGGVLEVFRNGISPSIFEEVWFNGRDHLEEEEAFGGAEGEALQQILAPFKGWNATYGGAAVKIDEKNGYAALSLDGNLDVTLLSPNARKLTRLAKKWDKDVASSEPQVTSRDGDDDDESFGTGRSAKKRVSVDSAPANGSSIAVLIKHADKSAVFCADAHPGILVKSLQAIGLPKSGRFDLVQLPHHGSASNVTSTLLNATPSHNYLFSTDGTHNGHPSVESVKRMLETEHCRGSVVWLNYPLKASILENVPDAAKFLDLRNGVAGSGAEIRLCE